MADVYALGWVAYYLLTGDQVFRRHGAQGDHSAPAGGAGRATGANRAADPGDARTAGAGLPRQQTRGATAERAATGAVTRHGWDDVGPGGGESLVEPTSPTAGVGIRRDYALRRGAVSIGIDPETAQVASQRPWRR